MFSNRSRTANTATDLSGGPTGEPLSPERLFRTIVLTGSAVLAGAGHAWATDLTTAADTHVTQAHSTTNYGTLSNLNVGSGYVSFLRFDLSSLPFGTTANQIGKATLRLYVNRVNAGGTVNLAMVNAPWAEYTLTGATAPSTTGLDSALPVVSAGQFVTLDITSVVQQWVGSPSTNYGLALSSSNASVFFDSKENDATSHSPQIDVSLVAQGSTGSTGATGATGPQGPAGPAGSAGATGPQGPQGTAGPQGTVGPQGIAGPQGTAGPQGVQGNTGPQGPQGTAGAQGNTGLQGPQGVQGTAGPQGVQGIPGATGPQGPTGPSGATGTLVYSANIVMAGSGSTEFYGVPLGQSLQQFSPAPSYTNVARVPVSCIASDLEVLATGTGSMAGATGTISLVVGPSSALGTPLPTTALSCSLTFGSGGTGGATASCSNPSIYGFEQGDLLSVRVQLSRTSTSNTVVVASFVCQPGELTY